MTFDKMIERHTQTLTAERANWFHPRSMRYFGTVLELEPLPIKLPKGEAPVFLFITSDRPQGGPKKFSVRSFYWESGRVGTVGPFYFFTERQARQVLNTLRKYSIETLIEFHDKTKLYTDWKEIRNALPDRAKVCR
jgi:hypothetical protein